MPHVENHPPGSVSWIELATTDQIAAKSFYTSLFGWSFEDRPMGPNGYYTMFRLEDRNLGAAYTLQEDQRTAGVPPHWMIYISTANADETTKRATELGGSVLCGPFDVFTYGRMSTIRDSTGAVFSIWQARDHSGFQIRDQHGTFCWADLNSPDQQRASKFYGDLFGWTTSPGHAGYMHIKNGENFIGGITSAQQQVSNAPPHWMIYIQVDDCDAATEKARRLGANIFVEPMTIENAGRMSIFADPQGAVLAVFQPLPRK